MSFHIYIFLFSVYYDSYVCFLFTMTHVRFLFTMTHTNKLFGFTALSSLDIGICLMIWNTYLLKKVSALVSLVEKVGKTPKDRLCVKEVGMDTATTAEFMTVVCDYMEIFLQVNILFVLK